MPQQEFLCQDCKRPFSKILPVAEYEEGNIACPHCGSSKVEQQGSPCYTSQKSQSSAQQDSIPPSQNEDSRERASSSATEEDDRARVLSDWEGEGGASGAEKVESVEQKLGKSVKKRRCDRPKIKQLTVPCKNRPGELARIAKVLGEAKVNVLSCVTTTSGEDGVTHVVCAPSRPPGQSAS